jgi:hypothetical protein
MQQLRNKDKIKEGKGREENEKKTHTQKEKGTNE